MRPSNLFHPGLRCGLLCGFLWATWPALAVRPAVAQDKVLRWHDNLDRAAQAARQSGKPLFVVFRCVR